MNIEFTEKQNKALGYLKEGKIYNSLVGDFLQLPPVKSNFFVLKQYSRIILIILFIFI